VTLISAQSIEATLEEALRDCFLVDLSWAELLFHFWDLVVFGLTIRLYFPTAAYATLCIAK